MTLIPLLASLGIGLCAGLFAGLFGVGGGVVIVPLLVLLLSQIALPASDILQIATGTSLGVIFFTSCRAIWSHHRRKMYSGYIHWYLGVGGMAGAWGGRVLAQHLHEDFVVSLFVFLILLAAMRLWIDGRKKQRPQMHIAKPVWVFLGTIIGCLGALLGLGGGILLVPTMAFFGYPMHRVLAISVVFNCFVSSMGAFQAARLGWSTVDVPYTWGYIYWPALLALSLGSTFAAPIGVHLAHQFSSQGLKRIFALFLIAIAGHMAYRILMN